MTSEFAWLAALQAVSATRFISAAASLKQDLTSKPTLKKPMQAYRELLDRVPRVYDDALARARKDYT
jgi:hypothetical protein